MLGLAYEIMTTETPYFAQRAKRRCATPGTPISASALDIDERHGVNLVANPYTG